MENNFDKELLAQILESSPECVVVYDGDGKVVFANCAAQHVLADSCEEIVGNPAAQVLPLIDTSTLLPLLPVRFPAGEICHYFIEALLRNCYGDMIVVDGHISALKDGFAVVVFRDIGEVKRSIKKHKIIPGCMPLSDLVNKENFALLLQGASTMHKEAGENFSIVRIDIDNFGQIFETVPREFSVEFLQQLTAILHCKISKKDTLAWFDDDNFFVLLKDCHEDDARHVVERIVKGVSEHSFTHGNDSFPITLSIAAISITDEPCAPQTETMLSLLEEACKEVYKAGGNSYKFVTLKKDSGGAK